MIDEVVVAFRAGCTLLHDVKKGLRLVRHRDTVNGQFSITEGGIITFISCCTGAATPPRLATSYPFFAMVRASVSRETSCPYLSKRHQTCQTTSIVESTRTYAPRDPPGSSDIEQLPESGETSFPHGRSTTKAKR